MTDKQLEGKPSTTPPPVTLPEDFKKQVKFGPPTDEDMNVLAQMRCGTDPWKSRGETQAESLEALTKLRPFLSVARLNNSNIGYITIERDGPVPGAAYLRNIVVKAELRQKGLGALVLDQGLAMAREMNRKTLALRVDPANAPAVAFYRKNGFTTVATVVSKKSGKLRLLMSREL
ncbi:MAG: GNAT family N-acetyltransferase [Myxococcota bacterium]